MVNGIEAGAVTPAMSVHLAPDTNQQSNGSTVLDRIMEQQATIGARYKPVLSPAEFSERYQALLQFKGLLVEGDDYTTLPGTEKPFLTKPGAQKACAYFGYVPAYEELSAIEDWSGKLYGEPLFYYKFRCILRRDGSPVGEGIGSANSWEAKHRYRWVPEAMLPVDVDRSKLSSRSTTIAEFAFAIERAETTGQYGKPTSYWQRWREAIETGEARTAQKITSKGKSMDAWEMGGTVYRVPNDQFADVINTCQKQGTKRAYVEATLSATGLSQFFTQDEEAMHALDPDPRGYQVDIGKEKYGTQEASTYVAERKIAELKQDSMTPGQRAGAKFWADKEEPQSRRKLPAELSVNYGEQRKAFDLAREVLSDTIYFQELSKFGVRQHFFELREYSKRQALWCKLCALAEVA